MAPSPLLLALVIFGAFASDDPRQWLNHDLSDPAVSQRLAAKATPMLRDKMAFLIPNFLTHEGVDILRDAVT